MKEEDKEIVDSMTPHELLSLWAQTADMTLDENYILKKLLEILIVEGYM